MSDFNVLGTNHTSFTVSSLDRFLGFLCEGLGFDLLNRSPRDPKRIEEITGIKNAANEVAYVQGPGHRLELIEYSSPADRKVVECRPCDPGYAHLAYDVDNLTGAIATAEKYTFVKMSHPVTVDNGPNKGNRIVYMRDVDGITVEFIEQNA